MQQNVLTILLHKEARAIQRDYELAGNSDNIPFEVLVKSLGARLADKLEVKKEAYTPGNNVTLREKLEINELEIVKNLKESWRWLDNELVNNDISTAKSIEASISQNGEKVEFEVMVNYERTKGVSLIEALDESVRREIFNKRQRAIA